MRIFRGRIYSDVDGLARRMAEHVRNLPSLPGLLPAYDLLWTQGSENGYIHSVDGVRTSLTIYTKIIKLFGGISLQARHGIHEWRRGKIHRTIWNMNDRSRYGRIKIRIAEGPLDCHIIINEICGVLARK